MNNQIYKSEYRRGESPDCVVRGNENTYSCRDMNDADLLSDRLNSAYLLGTNVQRLQDKVTQRTV